MKILEDLHKSGFMSPYDLNSSIVNIDNMSIDLSNSNHLSCDPLEYLRGMCNKIDINISNIQKIIDSGDKNKLANDKLIEALNARSK